MVLAKVLLMEQNQAAIARDLRTRANPAVHLMVPVHRTMRRGRVVLIRVPVLMEHGLMVLARDLLRNRMDGGSRTRRFDQAKSGLNWYIRGEPIGALKSFD